MVGYVMRARQKVFGVGFGKTGTCTLAVCLKRFGLTYAGFTQRFISRVKKGKVEDVIKAVEGVDSVANFPWNLLYRELDIAYPSSKFILTTRRNPEAWLKSVRIQEERRSSRGTGVHRAGMVAIFGVEEVLGNEQLLIDVYLKHNQGVMEYFEGRTTEELAAHEATLLPACWETGSGWSDLSSFLDLPCPTGRFPHIHWDESCGLPKST